MLRADCLALPRYDETELDSVRAAFEPAPPLALRQSWLAEPEADFQPGVVRVGCRDESLLVLAELTDADIFSRATRSNEKMWELGDTFEIFLRPIQQDAYMEFHVTPNNQRLQVRFPDGHALEAARRTGDLAPFLLAGDLIHTSVWHQSDARRWLVYARIPAAAVCDRSRPLAGQEWLFSFSRYDYTRGRPQPVLSSTSFHARLDFHSKAEWGKLTFRPGPSIQRD